MATRKKATRKKASRKKAAGKATQKKATRKTARKKTARKKPAVKAARKKAAGKPTATRSARKAAPKRKPAPAPEPPEVAIARKIIAAAEDSSSFELGDLYAPDCVSVEGNGMRFEGHSGMREKNAGWQAGLESSSWEAHHVFTRPGAISIEWEAQIKFKDGRSVRMREVAIHELRGGKIAAERYYYDPSSIAPDEPREPYTPSQIDPPSSDSGIDPMDL